MTTDSLRQRHAPASAQALDSEPTSEKAMPEVTQHPAGEIRHGPFQQALRMFLFAVYFNSSILA